LLVQKKNSPMATGSKVQTDLFEARTTDENGIPIPKVQVLSFGAGQDSTTLLELWLQEESFREQWPAERMIVIFSDTGDEHPSTYEHLSKQEERLKERDDTEFAWVTPDMGHHRDSWPSLIEHWEESNTIGSKKMPKSCSENLKSSVIYKYLEERLKERDDTEFAWVTPDMGHHRDSWPSLIEHWEESNTIGSKKMPKSCSENLKSSVIYKYLEERIGELFGFETGRKRALYSYKDRFGPIPVMLGIAAGEESRASGNDNGPKWMQRTVRRIYPLIEMGMDRSDCQDKLRELGADVPRPSLCQHCPFKKEADLLLMKERQPEELEKWIELEQQKLNAWEDRCEERGIENSTVWGDGRTLPEVIEDAEEKYEDSTTEEIADQAFREGHCVGTTY
jgi:hypothetical protein